MPHADYQGFIYGVTNPHMPGLLKVGLSRDVEQRRWELSNTSVPGDFEVRFVFAVSKMRTAESIAHRALADWRVDPSREFFRVEASIAKSKIHDVLKNDNLIVPHANLVALAQRPKTKRVKTNKKPLVKSYVLDAPIPMTVNDYFRGNTPPGFDPDKKVMDAYDTVNSMASHVLKLRPGALASLESVLFTSRVVNRYRQSTLFTTAPTLLYPVERQKHFVNFVYVSVDTIGPKRSLERDCVEDVKGRYNSVVTMATPERSLCDYLVVTNDSKYQGAYTPDLGATWDFSVLDMDRLGRLVEAYGIQDLWDDLSTSMQASEVKPRL